MGIEKFFNSIKTQYKTNIITDIKDKYYEKYLFVDFNSIIYQESGKIESMLKNLYKIYLTSKTISSYLEENQSEIEKILEYLTTDLPFFKTLSLDDINENFFKTLFKSKIYEKLLISKICDYLNYLIGLFEKLEFVYVSVDGVPLYAKMLHQKSRRFNKNFMQKAQKKLLKYYKSELNQEISLDNRIFFNQYEYEKDVSKFKFDTLKISPATKFMTKLENKLSKYYKNKNFTFILDRYSNSGEAEMKILSKIKNTNIDNIVVYSPDSDIIFLMMLSLKKITILYNNQQLKKLENVSVINYKNILISYLKIDKFSEISKNKIIIDVIMILTVLGNDFIPKIYEINTFTHINDILNSYLEINSTIKLESEYKFIFDKSVNYSLLLIFFTNLFNKISQKKDISYPKKYRYQHLDLYNDYYKTIYDLENLFNDYNLNFDLPPHKYKFYKKYFIGYQWLYEYYIKNNFSYKLFGMKHLFIPKLNKTIKYLKKFISKNKIDLTKYYIEEDKFLKPITHLSFISPKSIVKYIDKEKYSSLIDKLEHYNNKFNTKIKVEITDGKINIKDYFNCYTKSFFNNCHLILLEKTNIRKVIKFYQSD